MPAKKRIVLCRGQFCNADRRADKLYKRLEALLVDINGDAYPPPVKIEIATCLDMCGAGPNMILYPDGLAFHHLDIPTLEAIVAEHLKNDPTLR